MQNEELAGPILLWEKIGHKIYSTHFSSTNKCNGFANSQVYVKRYEAINNDPQKNITIFLLHDIGQYHGRFQDLINWTRTKNPGVSFIAMDFVGHGLSSGTRGHLEKFDHLVNDFLYLLRTLEKDHANNEKWIILGHGMGGLVALDTLDRFQSADSVRIDGLILSNFILKFSSVYLQLEARLKIGQGAVKKLLAHLRLLYPLKGEEILSSPDAILSYEQDPLVVTGPTLNSLLEIQKKVNNIYQHSYFLENPIMLLNSENGGITQGHSIGYFAKGIKKDLLTEKKYTLMKHDLYNEIEREKVFEDIMDWMKTI